MKGVWTLILLTLVSRSVSSKKWRQELQEYYDELEYLMDLEDAYNYDEYYGGDDGGHGGDYNTNDGDYNEGNYGGGDTGPDGEWPPVPATPKPKPSKPVEPAKPPAGNKPPATFPTDCGVNRYNNQRRSFNRRDLVSLLREMRGTEDMDLGMIKRIMGGTEAKKGKHPYISFIVIQHGDGGEAICGGSLITPEWILSAGHCLFGPGESGYPPFANQLDKLTIVLGEHNNNPDVKEASEQVFTPVKVIVHPGYNPHSPSEENDIALIKLPKPATLNEDVRLICMPDGPVQPGTTCYAAGWGKNRQGKTPEKLHEVELRTISQATCQPYHQEKRLFGGMMCAMHPPNKVMGDSCEGDSGGPLACMINGKAVLTGATSFGVDCAKGDKAPGVYANVFYYKDWVAQTIGNN